MSVAKLSYSGVDYVTVTRPDHQMAGEWEELVYAERVQEQIAGRKEHFRWMQGYYGIVGEHFFVGRGEQGTMLRLSGAICNSLYPAKCLDGAKCSRIDIQVTGQPPCTPDEYMRESYERLKLNPKKEGHPQLVELRDTNYGAKMLTIGSRTSELYARVYDKFKESKDEHYRGMVRLEIEVKKPQSDDLFNWLRKDTMLLFHCKHIVAQYFESKGMEMFFKDYELSEPPQSQKRHKSDASKCAWIASQVNPTLKKLVDNGKHLEAAKALLNTDEENANILELALLLRECLHS